MQCLTFCLFSPEARHEQSKQSGTKKPLALPRVNLNQSKNCKKSIFGDYFNARKMDSKCLEACPCSECALCSCHKIFKAHPYMKLKLLLKLISTLTVANPQPSVLIITL